MHIFSILRIIWQQKMTFLPLVISASSILDATVLPLNIFLQASLAKRILMHQHEKYFLMTNTVKS